MAFEDLTPNGNFAIHGWGKTVAGAGDASYTEVDEGVDSNDGDTTKVVGNGNHGTFENDFTNPTLTGPFSTLTARLAVRAPSGTLYLQISPFINGVGLSPITINCSTLATAAYLIYSATWTGSWTAADLATLTAGFEAVSVGGSSLTLEGYVSAWAFRITEAGGSSGFYGFNSSHVTAAGLVLPRRSVVIWPY